MAKSSEQKKNWSARFNKPVNELVKKFTSSVNFDKKLYKHDIKGSLAHAEMLMIQKIITKSDYKLITKGLKQISQEIKNGKFVWSIEYEDVHTNIERRLITLIGDPGKKLHTGRSRNDQVATDIKLYLRDAIDNIFIEICKFNETLIKISEKNINTIMPGFTHLQIAQPISFGHHIMAYFEMFFRDSQRLQDCRKRLNYSPLGSAALAGTTFGIDRKFSSDKLNFSSPTSNSLDSVSDRDFAIEFCSVCSIIFMHLSRLSEEIIFWCSPMINFVELSDDFCTGSSIMPQKKNPDVAELARGKTGRIFGHLISILTIMKSQPLAYNKDNQEDKEPLFDTVETTTQTIIIFTEMLKKVVVNKREMKKTAQKGFSTATDLADYLVREGIPFKESHDIVSNVVKYCLENKIELQDIKKEILCSFSNRIKPDVKLHLTLEGSVNSRNHSGGTSIKQVKKEIFKAKKKIEKFKKLHEKIK